MMNRLSGSHKGRNKLTHCLSEHGGKQMLHCQAKYTQTPYQFMEVMDPAGRRSPLASRGSLDVARHIRNCMEPVHMAGEAFWERWSVHTVRPFRRLTEERWRENEKAFMGELQENACYITITPYDCKICRVSRLNKETCMLMASIFRRFKVFISAGGNIKDGDHMSDFS